MSLQTDVVKTLQSTEKCTKSPKLYLNRFSRATIHTNSQKGAVGAVFRLGLDEETNSSESDFKFLSFRQTPNTPTLKKCQSPFQKPI